MKQFLFLFFICLFSSCKKDSELRSVEKEITGTWEFEKFTGYPFTQQPLPPGNGQLIIFGKNRSFERRKNDTLLFKGTFLLSKKRDCYESDTDVIFSTTESSNTYQYIKVTDGKLTLSTPNCYADGGIAYYRKIN